MKTIEIKSFTTLLIVILTIFGQYINAADYQTFYLDSINNNDTIIYCSGNDSVRLIPPTGADVWAWITNNDSDTILVDTLILPNGCEGLVRCQGAGIVAEVFYIFPFKVDAGEDKTTICGGSTQLKATSNYTGTGMLSYAWSPTTGLDNSTIFNPMAAITQIPAAVVRPFTYPPWRMIAPAPTKPTPVAIH